MFGDLPAWAYFRRHASGVTFSSSSTSLSHFDARPKLVTSDVIDLYGAP